MLTWLFSARMRDMYNTRMIYQVHSHFFNTYNTSFQAIFGSNVCIQIKSYYIRYKYIICICMCIECVSRYICVNLPFIMLSTNHHVAYMTAQNCNDYNLICSMYYLRVCFSLFTSNVFSSFVHSFIHFASPSLLFSFALCVCVWILIFLHSNEELDLLNTHTLNAIL